MKKIEGYKKLIGDVLMKENDLKDLSPENIQPLDEELEKLTSREKKVLSLIYGLDDGIFCTLEEVGKDFNTTHERIQQILVKSLRKLRAPSHVKIFKSLSK